MTTATDDYPTSRHGWIVPVLFWLSLLVAVGAYGLVALAPKYLEHLELAAEHRAARSRLLELDRQTRTLEQVAQALESDPDFVAELARVDFDAALPGEERIAVAEAHRLDPGRAAEHSTGTAAALPWHAPIVRTFAENRRLRRTLLIGAAAIVLGAFTLLHDTPGGSSSLAWLAARYRRDDDAVPPG